MLCLPSHRHSTRSIEAGKGDKACSEGRVESGTNRVLWDDGWDAVLNLATTADHVFCPHGVCLRAILQPAIRCPPRTLAGEGTALGDGR